MIQNREIFRSIGLGKMELIENIINKEVMDISVQSYLGKRQAIFAFKDKEVQIVLRTTLMNSLDLFHFHNALTFLTIKRLINEIHYESLFLDGIMLLEV